MNHEDLERLLADAFDARARDRIADDRRPPAFDEHETHRVSPRRRRSAVLAPLAAAAAVAALVVGGVALFDRSPDHHRPASAGSPTHQVVSVPAPTPSTPSPASSGPASSPAATQDGTAAAAAVHVKLKFGDGAHVGVGMPVIAYFSRAITSAKALSAATTVTADGKPMRGAWYFEPSGAEPGYPLEAHFRLQTYWPAHAKIHLALPVQGLPAGNGMSYDDSLTLDFTTGAANIATVYEAKHQLVLTSDNKPMGTFPVSLGAAATPTSNGIKVIMTKGRNIAMRGPGYYQPNVRFAQRLTYSGEYLNAAPWNIGNIDRGVDSSNGCTNLSTANAQKLYKLLEVGDVVEYPDSSGPKMRMDEGYGDWNVPWKIWQTGGAVPTH